MKWSKRRWLILLVTLLAVWVTASLGRWQLSRAQQKLDGAAERQAQASKPLLDGQSLNQSDAALKALVGRRLSLKGQWVPQATVYLDNRQMQGRPGFEVLTPLQLSDSPVVILVQRGWIPRSFVSRTDLQPIVTPAGEVSLQGILTPWPSRLYDFAEQEKGPIRQNLDSAAYRQETGLTLSNWTVRQTGEASEGLLRQWNEVATGVEKHWGYAFQWFGLSGLLILLYVWFQIVQPRRTSTPR